jgi:hypothetical protein
LDHLRRGREHARQLAASLVDREQPPHGTRRYRESFARRVADGRRYSGGP